MTDRHPEQEPVSARRESLSIDLAEGAALEVTLLVPPRARATIVCLPALGVVASYYEPLALALADRGLAVATADLRGLGRSSVRARRGVDWGYACLVDDTARILATVRERAPSPLHVLGHSLGGHVGAMVAGLGRGAMDGLILAACGTPYWRRFPFTTGVSILGLAWTVRTLGLVLGYVPGNRLGFGGVEAAQLMKEWGHLARRGRFVIPGLDAERVLRDVRVPTLVISLDGDWMAPASAADHLAGKLANAPLTRVHVTRGMADRRTLDHFRWARFPDPVADRVATWIPDGEGGVERESGEVYPAARIVSTGHVASRTT